MSQILTETTQLDISRQLATIIDTFQQLDDNSRGLVFQITYRGRPISIDGLTAQMEYCRPDGKRAMYSCIVSDNTVKIIFSAAMTAIGGIAVGKIILTGSDSSILHTTSFKIKIDDALITDEEIIDDEDYNLLLKAIKDANEATARANSAADRVDKEGNDLNQAIADGQEIIKNITAEGTNQIDLIQKTGEEVLSSIPSDYTDLSQEIEKARTGYMGTEYHTLDERIDGDIKNLFDTRLDSFMENYFAIRRTGKIFSTKLYKIETSQSPQGERMNDSVGLECTPSEGTVRGKDDFAQFGLFECFDCNFIVDENGFNHITALDGTSEFKRTGEVQVGVVTMSGWFGIEDTGDSVIYHYSDTKSDKTPNPMKESINPDGTIRGFMIHAKYICGDIGGKPYSSSGLIPANGAQAFSNPISYTGMIDYMHKLGNHYCGLTSWDLFYKQLMMIIKYATRNSQGIMSGCTNYSFQYQVAKAENAVTRVILTKEQGARFKVGSYVSIGDKGDNSNIDRYYGYMHNKAKTVKITQIEDIDESNTAIYVDSEQFDTTLTTYISTMPWRSGSTDGVPGNDGSAGDNKSGIYPFKIQGIETSVGAYEVLGNVVMDIVEGGLKRDIYICHDASKLKKDIATVKIEYQKSNISMAITNAQWKYISEETTDESGCLMIPTKIDGGSATGWCDALYTDTGSSGQREWLAVGALLNGSGAGLWFLVGNSSWSDTGWAVVSGVSPNGTRGEYRT